jgi:small Trp-rich protein
MYLVWIGLILLGLKWLEIEPIAQWGWHWILLPLIGAFAWFEVLERTFGRDRRKVEHVEWEKRRKDRVREQFAPPPHRKAPASGRR